MSSFTPVNHMAPASFMDNLRAFLQEHGKVAMSQRIAENVLNPARYHLSDAAKQRLRWMYVIERECDGNLTRASKKLNVSREWLTKLHRLFLYHDRDPRSLEPQSRAPRDTSKRSRISLKAEGLIVKIRKKYPAWGKDKIVRILKRDHHIQVGHSTVGRYLTKHHLVDLKLTLKNERAWKRRKALGGKGAARRERFPRGLEDAGPGALIAKDMKLIAKSGFSHERRRGKDRAGHLFWYQHTMLDSCSRRRVVAIVESADSRTARDAYQEASTHFPYSIANITSDNGSENDGYFDLHLQNTKTHHYWSRPGVPTDNPRVERSHLADDQEFHRFHRSCDRSFTSLKKDEAEWDRIWNDERPHQALNYLTPTEYEKLWITDRTAAIKIQTKWKAYLSKQSLRLRATRKEERTDTIHVLNAQLKAKLGVHFIPLKV